MMTSQSLWSRALLLLHIRSSAVLDEAEDPREVMNYAYNQRLEMARTMRKARVEMATVVRQLDLQIERLRMRATDLAEQASEAVNLGRDDLARLALERKHSILAEVAALERQRERTAVDEAKLADAQQRASSEVEAIRARRNLVVARYAAASAQLQTREALLGFGDEAVQLDLAVIRAEERAEHLQARVDALESITAAAVEEAYGSSEPLDHELRTAAVRRAAETELESLKKRRRSASGGGEEPERGDAHV